MQKKEKISIRSLPWLQEEEKIRIRKTKTSRKKEVQRKGQRIIVDFSL
jgi:hypothetical protein